MMDFVVTFQHWLTLVCFVALAVCLFALAVLRAIPELTDAIRRFCGMDNFSKVVCGVCIVGAVLYGGSKGVNVRWDDGLRDNGTLITNDTVAVRWTYSGIPGASSVFIDYREAGTTNNWLNLAETLASAQEWTGTLANATNYDYWVYSTYVPPVPVHTNGVWVGQAYETKAKVGAAAFLFLNGKVVADGRTIAPPKWAEPYVPTARDYIQNGLVAMWDGINHGDNELIWRDLSGNGYDATQRVANAGWRWDGDCYRGTSQNSHGFRTPQALVDFFRSNITNHTVEIVYRPTASSRETILGQYYGSAVGLNIEYAPHLAGYFRVYWGAAPDFNSPAWKTLGMVRMTTTMLCNGTNCQIYENGAYKTQAAQPNVDRVGVKSLIIGGENSRPNMSIRGELCIVRIYSRALSADEIRHNYNIDKRRFNLP